MNISVFDTATGRILRAVATPVGMAGLQCMPGEDWIEGAYPDDKFYVDAFAPAAMPPKPTQYHVFNYTTKQWEDPRTAETQWQLVRVERNQLLVSCDWTQLQDVSPAIKDAWAPYRQALRDITNQPNPFNITWPTPPGA